MPDLPAYPLRFDPICQYRLWGGRNLARWLDRPLPKGLTGEAWLISDREAMPSRVSDGPLKGRTLSEIIKQSPQFILGELASRFDRFPLLLKYLDVSKMLSVQVHPSEAHANLIPQNEQAKTEGWVVLESSPGSRIYAGLKPGATRDRLRTLSIATADNLLASFTPEGGESVLIRAGDVHALGKGVVVLEVQQNSDVTFRLYDWDHIDATTGKKRPLQVENALTCVDLTQGAISPTVPVTEATGPVLRERLLACPYFRLWRLTATIRFDIGRHNAPTIVVCMSGAGHIEHKGVDYPLHRGGVMLLPAATGPCSFRPDGVAQLACIDVP